MESKKAKENILNSFLKYSESERTPKCKSANIAIFILIVIIFDYLFSNV